MTGTTPLSGQAGLPTANSTNSFWHSDPSKILIGHRTTSNLPAETDIVIVGSGISGACAAHFLKEDARATGLNIVMLEAREACWGATGRNGGHCQAMVYHNGPEIAAFELRNYQFLQDLVVNNDIQCDWKTLSGVHSYLSESMFTAKLKEFRKLQELDPKIAATVNVITKESKSPSLDDLRVSSASGAFLQQHAASLWPYKLVCWILERLLATNDPSNPAFNLQTNTPATRLQKTGNGWIVHTSRGMIACKKMILTTNAYTSHLLPGFSDLIVPVRGEMSSLIPPISMRPDNKNPPLEHSYGFIGNGKQNINQDDYLIQRPYSKDCSGGELMFGGGRSYAAQSGVGVSDDSSIDPPAAAYLRREISLLLDLQNHEQELKASYEWSGIMGYSRDDRPWVGEVTENLGLGGGHGLWVCAGFTGHGMPNTSLSARATVELMLGTKAADVDLPGPYRLSKERVRLARMLDEVHIADEKGQY